MRGVVAMASVRREIKYLVHPRILPALRNDLGRWLRADEYSTQAGGGYRVHTAYFDSPELLLYWDKADGEGIRAKVRMRWYGEEGGRGWLEVKRRLHGGFEKRRAGAALPERFSESRSIASYVPRPDLSRLLAGAGVPEAVFPVVTVSYRRSAWDFAGAPPVRVTLDTALRGKRVNVRGPGRALVEPGWAVLELKADGPAPGWWRTLAAKYRLEAAAVSKYALGIERGVRRGLAV